MALTLNLDKKMPILKQNENQKLFEKSNFFKIFFQNLIFRKVFDFHFALKWSLKKIKKYAILGCGFTFFALESYRMFL